MIIRRTLRTLVLTGLLLAALTVSPAFADSDAEEDAASSASLDETPFDPTDPEQVFRDIVFPIVGSVSYSPGFGDCRDGCSRSHAGIDISSFGWKGLPVVAAHDGTVVSTRIGGELSGCSVTIRADDGWTTHYVHLNTDTPGTDDGNYACFAPSIEIGSRVSAGTVIGWIGDSGNAEHTVPNLHFEIRNPEGIAVDPWVSLEAAQRIDHEWANTESILDLTTSIYQNEGGTIVVVDTANLDDLAASSGGPTLIDVPLVPYDARDPAPALSAISELAPARIVVLAGSDSQRLVDELQTYALLVDIGALAGLKEPQPTFNEHRETDTPPMTFKEEETDRFTILIGGRLAAIPRSVRNRIEAEGLHQKILILSSKRSAPMGIGPTIADRLSYYANRNGLWWITSEGWLMSESTEEAPDPGFAYVDEDHANDAILSYLVSQAISPAMPLWHYQPTSRATRSL